MTNDFANSDRNPLCLSNRPPPPPLFHNYDEIPANSIRTTFPGARPFPAAAPQEHNESDYRRHGISHEQQLEQLELVRHHQMQQHRLTSSQSTSDIHRLTGSDLEQVTSTPKQVQQSLYGTLGRARNREGLAQSANAQKRLRNVCVKLFGSNPNLPLVSHQTANSVPVPTSTAPALSNPDLCIPRSSKLLAASVTGTASSTKSTVDASALLSSQTSQASHSSAPSSSTVDHNDPNVIYAEIRRKEPNVTHDLKAAATVTTLTPQTAADKYDKYVVEVGQSIGKSIGTDSKVDANHSSQSLIVKDSPAKSEAHSDSVKAANKRPEFLSQTSHVQPDSPLTSSSESGRGTLPGDSQTSKSQSDRCGVQQQFDVKSLENDEPTAQQRHRRFEQVQMQLQKILDDCGSSNEQVRARALSLGPFVDAAHRLSVVEESEHSWLSDASARSAPAPSDHNGRTPKVEAADSQSVQSGNCDRPRSRSVVAPETAANERSVACSNGVAELASFSKAISGSARSKRSIGRTTTNLSQSVEDLADVQSIITEMSYAPASKRQIKGLEHMYGEILKLLSSRMSQVKTNDARSNQALRRNRFGGSDSSLNTEVGRPTVRPTRPHLRSKLSGTSDVCNNSARRLKQLEQHVLMLTRTVSQLTSELRTCQANCAETHNLRKEVELLRNRLHSTILLTDDHNNNTHAASHTMHMHSGSATLPRKMAAPTAAQHASNRGGLVNGFRRLFVDDAPQIRQFLKKIGCEVSIKLFFHKFYILYLIKPLFYFTKNKEIRTKV
jgi:regulator of replication initiation timing